MAYTNTTLLGLNQPTTGQESGVWGDDVNNGFTQLVDLSVAGTNNITQDSDITLAVSNGNNASSFTSTATNSTVAQYAILNCTGARTAARNIIAPATSKTYFITNGTTGGYAITIKKTAGTGVSIAAGETAVVFYNTVSGDYVKATSISTAGVVLPANGGTGVANGTNNTITFTGNYTLGLTLTGNTSLTLPTSGYAISTVTNMAANPVTGTPSSSNFLRGDGTWAAPAGTVPTPYTANGVVYASSTSALATGSTLVFDGTNLSVGTTALSSGKISTIVDLSVANGVVVRDSATTYANNDNFVLLQNSTGGTVGGFTHPASLSLGVWGSDDIRFFTTTGASERMRLDNSGNLGIGTTSPSVQLHISKAGSNAARVTNSSVGAFAELGRDGTGGYVESSGAYPLQFYTNSSERMRISSSGLVGIGTNSPSNQLHVLSSGGTNTYFQSSGASVYLKFGNSLATDGFIGYESTGGNQMTFYTANTEKMRLSSTGGLSVGTTADPGAGAIYATGNITAYYSSDAKFKENVQDIPDALGIVTAIGSKTFEWTDEYLADHGGEDEYFQPKQSFGVIAQDVQKVFPQAVRTRQDGSLAVDYEKLAILSFGAIGQLLKRVEALEAK